MKEPNKLPNCCANDWQHSGQNRQTKLTKSSKGQKTAESHDLSRPEDPKYENIEKMC